MTVGSQETLKRRIGMRMWLLGNELACPADDHDSYSKDGSAQDSSPMLVVSTVIQTDASSKRTASVWECKGLHVFLRMWKGFGHHGKYSSSLLPNWRILASK